MHEQLNYTKLHLILWPNQILVYYNIVYLKAMVRFIILKLIPSI